MAEEPPPGGAPRPTLVLDLDGTLVDTAVDLVASLNVILSDEGLPPVSLTDAPAMIGHGVSVTLERAFAAAGHRLAGVELDRVMQAFLTHYTDHMADHSRAYPGAEIALAQFQAAGWQLAVCTNKHEATARRLLEVLQVDGYFAAICGADTFGYRKPDPRHLLRTIRAAGGTPARAVMVGDSPTDVDTAIGAAVPIVVVTFGYSTIPVEELGADLVVDDLRALFDAVSSLQSGAGATAHSTA